MAQFDALLAILEPHIKKKTTNFCELSVQGSIYSALCCETKWMNLTIAILDFGVRFYGGSELSKHLSKCLPRMRKTQWLPGWSTTVSCFVMVVHESLVCSEQLNGALFFRKILHVLQILQFSSIFCIFEPFPAVTVWFWDPSYHTEDNWGTQTQLFKRVSNIHWCSRRKYDALRAGGGGELLNRMMSKCFFCRNIYIFFHLVLPFGSNRRYFHVSGRQIMYNLPWSSNSKSFHPPALNASCFLQEKKVWTFLYIHTYIHTYIYIYIYTHTHTRIHVCVCIYIYIYMRV